VRQGLPPDVAGGNLEYERLADLRHAPEEQLILLQGQVVVARLRQAAVPACAADRAAGVGLTQQDADGAGAGGDKIQIPAHPVEIGRSGQGLREVRQSGAHGSQPGQGLPGSFCLGGTLPGRAVHLHNADMLRLEDAHCQV